MYTFKQHLNEIFDNPSPWKWTDHGPGYHTATFILNKDIINVRFEDEDDDNSWEFTFERNGKYGQYYARGKEIQIFATVIDVLKDFIKTKKPEEIEFSAEGASRVRLYRRFTTQAAKMFGMKHEESSGEGNSDASTKLTAYASFLLYK